MIARWYNIDVNSNPCPRLRGHSRALPTASSRPLLRHSSLSSLLPSALNLESKIRIRSGRPTPASVRFPLRRSNHCVFIRLQTHLRNGRVVSPSPSIVCTLFSLRRRVYPPSFQNHTFGLFFLCDLCVRNASGGRIRNPFRMNTCKSVSKQRTLSTFRMNTYEKHRGGGLFWLTRNPMKGFYPERPSGAKDLSSAAVKPGCPSTLLASASQRATLPLALFTDPWALFPTLSPAFEERIILGQHGRRCRHGKNQAIHNRN